MGALRVDFETWAAFEWQVTEFEQDANGIYHNDRVQSMWIGYSAGRTSDGDLAREPNATTQKAMAELDSGKCKNVEDFKRTRDGKRRDLGMTIIKKNSWHFKILSIECKDDVCRLAREGKLTKCGYYSRVGLPLIGWLVVFALALMMAVLALMLLYLLGYGFYALAVYMFFDPTVLDPKDILGAIAMHSILWITVFISFGLSWYTANKNHPVLCKTRKGWARFTSKLLCKPIGVE